MNWLIPKVERLGDVTILTFSGSTVREIENRLAAQLQDRTDALGECHLLLDFINVERISSEELGTLIGLHKTVLAAGGRLTLFNLSQAIYEVFTVCHLHTFLSICRGQDRPLAPAAGLRTDPPTPGWTPQDRLRDIAQLRRRVTAHIESLFDEQELAGLPAGATRDVLETFHGRMIALERLLGRIREDTCVG